MSRAEEYGATIALADGPLRYTIRRTPRAHAMRITVDDRRGVIVSLPPASRRGWADPEPGIERFLRERGWWIRRQLERQRRERELLAARGGLTDGSTFRFAGELHRLRIVEQPATRSTIERVGSATSDEIVIGLAARDRARVAEILGAWLWVRARQAIDREIGRHAPAMGVEPTTVAIRDPRSRWGSASREGRLMFSWRLSMAPPEALETVVIHELAHLRVFGHGPAFWRVVASRRPDHLEWRRWLRQHSFELHHALDGPANAPLCWPSD